MIIQSVEKIYSRGILTVYLMIINNEKYGVPLDEANTDYQAIQEWSAIDGNNIIDNGGGE